MLLRNIFAFGKRFLCGTRFSCEKFSSYETFFACEALVIFFSRESFFFLDATILLIVYGELGGFILLEEGLLICLDDPRVGCAARRSSRGGIMVGVTGVRDMMVGT